MRYEFFVAVWDEPFVRKYINFPVASYLSAGNLPAVAAEAEVRFHIEMET